MPILQLDRIRDECDELGIGRFPFPGADRIAEQFIERIQLPPAPCHLDGVPYGPLHTA